MRLTYQDRDDAGASRVAIINQTDWNVAFWFAVLSPVLGILAGFLALFVFYR